MITDNTPAIRTGRSRFAKATASRVARRASLLMKALIPVICLLAGAAGLVWYLGAAEPRDSTAPQSDNSQCTKHGLPRDECPFCDKSLIDKLGMCVGHGLPEALCWICNPDLIPAFKAENDWCAGHNRPESQCTLCKGEAPTETSASTASQDGAQSGPDTPRSQRPPNADCEVESRRVHLASSDIARRTGLTTATVERQTVTKTIDCSVEITYDTTRFVRVSSRVGGVIRHVRKDLGDLVATGDVLFVVDSAELAAAKADCLQAAAAVNLWEQNHAREAALLDRGLSTARDLLETEAKLAEARIGQARSLQQLKILGVSEFPGSDGAKFTDADSLLEIATPLAGLVVERSVVVGETVDSGTTLMAVADVSHMWAMLDIYEGDAGRVKVGQQVTIEFDGLPDEALGGRISWVSTQIDPRTRTLKARADLDNPGGLLRAHMFGRGRIAVIDGQPLIVVPKTAVQWDGDCNIVFIRHGDTEYEPRKVKLGYEIDGLYEVLAGVEPGDSVITQGSFLLKTELMKENIGEGCCPSEIARK